MHQSCYNWVGKVVAEYGLSNLPVLEVGSQNVNGSVRDHFSTDSYIGVDIGPGNSVDRIEDAERLSDPSATWPVVISCEMLEHARRPWMAVAEMARVCSSPGHVILSCRGYDTRGCWSVHGYPDDYWRVSEGAMRVMMEDAGLEVLEILSDPEGPGVFAIAIKQ